MEHWQEQPLGRQRERPFHNTRKSFLLDWAISLGANRQVEGARATKTLSNQPSTLWATLFSEVPYSPSPTPEIYPAPPRRHDAVTRYTNLRFYVLASVESLARMPGNIIDFEDS